MICLSYSLLAEGSRLAVLARKLLVDQAAVGPAGAQQHIRQQYGGAALSE